MNLGMVEVEARSPAAAAAPVNPVTDCFIALAPPPMRLAAPVQLILSSCPLSLLNQQLLDRRTKGLHTVVIEFVRFHDTAPMLTLFCDL